MVPTRPLFALRLQAVLPTAVACGLAAAAVGWIGFAAVGGALGLERQGELVQLAIFLVQLAALAAAGFALRRAGQPFSTAALGGLAAGLVQAIAYGFPETSALLLNHAYMTWLQYTATHSNSRFLYLPHPPLTLLAALLGALLAGAVIGAACGSVGAAAAPVARDTVRPLS